MDAGRPLTWIGCQRWCASCIENAGYRVNGVTYERTAQSLRRHRDVANVGGYLPDPAEFAVAAGQALPIKGRHQRPHVFCGALIATVIREAVALILREVLHHGTW